MNAKTEVSFKSALSRSASKAGVDISAVKWEGCSTDRTWGDRVGVVFFGASPEVNERAAKFFEAWYRKHAPSSCYDAQRSIGFEGVFHFARYSNGAKGWHRGPSGEKPTPLTLSDGFVVERVEAFEGFAVSTTYYPCAD